MKKVNRRQFCKSILGSAASAAILPARSWSANDEIGIGVIGFNGKGKQHIKMFLDKIKGARVVGICDADQAIIDREMKKIKKGGGKIETYQDARKMLENKDIDAIVIATPNHLHSLLSIWGCQAGKDVYVEKPLSHNIWEGRKVVEAMKKYNRIVQIGTQNRSDVGMIEAIDWINAGNMGKVKRVWGTCIKKRASIRKVDGPQEPPSTVDYNLWQGPAQEKPLMRKRFHYDWHWQWDYGSGAAGNQGIHELDMVRWALGDPKPPKRVFSFGSRFVWDDDGQTPNIQLIEYDYGNDIQVLFQIICIRIKPDVKRYANFRGQTLGIIVECEGGEFRGGRNGGWSYDKNGKKMKQFVGDGGRSHQQNFIDAVRSRDGSNQRGPVENGHVSTIMSHLANISHRTGTTASKEEITEKIKNDPLILERFNEYNTYLVNHQVDLKKTPYTFGDSLSFDHETEKFTGDRAEAANKFLSRDYRKPFDVPEKV